MKYLSHLPLFVYLPAYYYFLRKRLTTDRLARQQTQTTKFRDSSPISTREAMSAPQSLTLLAGQKLRKLFILSSSHEHKMIMKFDSHL